MRRAGSYSADQLFEPMATSGMLAKPVAFLAWRLLRRRAVLCHAALPAMRFQRFAGAHLPRTCC